MYTGIIPKLTKCLSITCYNLHEFMTVTCISCLITQPTHSHKTLTRFSNLWLFLVDTSKPFSMFIQWQLTSLKHETRCSAKRGKTKRCKHTVHRLLLTKDRNQGSSNRAVCKASSFQYPADFLVRLEDCMQHLPDGQVKFLQKVLRTFKFQKYSTLRDDFLWG